MKSSNLPVIIYIAAAGLSIIISLGEGRFGVGSMLILLLTFPWSASMIIFAWVLIHDGARALLIFLIPLASLNAFLIYRLTNRRKGGRQDSGSPAA